MHMHFCIPVRQVVSGQVQLCSCPCDQSHNKGLYMMNLWIGQKTEFEYILPFWCPWPFLIFQQVYWQELSILPAASFALQSAVISWTTVLSWIALNQTTSDCFWDSTTLSMHLTLFKGALLCARLWEFVLKGVWDWKSTFVLL